MTLEQKGKPRQAHNCSKQNVTVAHYKGQVNHHGLICVEASKGANNIQTV